MGLTRKEYDLICIIEQFWKRNKLCPTNITIKQRMNKLKYDIKEKDVEDLFQSEAVQRALDLRGISLESKDGLSVEQMTLANLLLNTSDNRSIPEKCKAAGVTTTKYAGWKKQKLFREYIQQQAEELFSENVHEAQIALLKKVNTGDFKAIRLYLEMVGKYSPKADAQTSLAELQSKVIRLLAVIEQEVPDQTVRARISKKFMSIEGAVPAGFEVQQLAPVDRVPVDRGSD